MKRAACDARGVALVQVLIMSVLLTILATGLLKMTFGTHVIIAKVRHTDIRKQWVDACQAYWTAVWASGGCNASNSCSTGTVPNWTGPTVTISCPSGRAVFTVDN